jgi:hypothetical protein
MSTGAGGGVVSSIAGAVAAVGAGTATGAGSAEGTVIGAAGFLIGAIGAESGVTLVVGFGVLRGFTVDGRVRDAAAGAAFGFAFGASADAVAPASTRAQNPRSHLYEPADLDISLAPYSCRIMDAR